MVLGQLHPNPKTNLNSNRNSSRGAIFFRGNGLVAPNPKTNPDLDPNSNPNRGPVFLREQLSGHRNKWITKTTEI